MTSGVDFIGSRQAGGLLGAAPDKSEFMRSVFRFLLTAGIICITLADTSPLRARDSIWPEIAPMPVCPTTGATRPVEGKWRPVKDIEVADDYCNARCDQQFDYCRYRDEPLERCIRRLATCRARC
jgi:hypothetical protein